jgi:hypothetical protein
MPVEIKELVIRAVAQRSDNESKGCGEEDSDSASCEGGGGGSSASDASIDRTVQQVLRILRARRER